MDIVTSPRLQTPLAALFVVITLLAVAAGVILAKDDADTRVMMYYGSWDVEEMFDATRWFTSGMYTPRNIEANGSASNVTMLRNQLPKLTTAQISEFALAAGQAFGMSSYDGLDIEPFVLSEPDLSKRYRYAYSAFAKPNQPEDYFYLYLDVLNRQFVATLSVDAQSGGELTGKYVQEVHADQPTDAEHIKVFAEIAEAERKAN